MKTKKRRFYDNFGKIWSASGALGYSGEGYWFHEFLEAVGIRIGEITLAGKTTTLEPRPSIEMVARCKYDLDYRRKFETLMGNWRVFAAQDCGNMPFELEAPFQPTELFPKSIWSTPFSEFLGNSISLSGPGLPALRDAGIWQYLPKNFMGSFMSVKTDESAVIDEYHEMAKIFNAVIEECQADFVGLQENITCPNVKHGAQISGTQDQFSVTAMIKKAEHRLDVPFPAPRIIKINAFAPIEFAREICQHPNCGGICISNTFTVEQLKQHPELYARFLKAIGKKSLPLRWYPSAGFSGPAIYEYVLEWLREFREDGNDFYVNAGGGLDSPQKVVEIMKFADSIMLGCSFTKAKGIWNTNCMIDAANR